MMKTVEVLFAHQRVKMKRQQKIKFVMFFLVFTMLITTSYAATCGDGLLDFSEECEYLPGTSFIPVIGFVSNDYSCPGTCLNDCSCAVCGVCGDGVLNVAEQCDDSNVVNGDGCDSTCQIEVCQADLDIILTIDNSRSMDIARMNYVKDAAKLFAQGINLSASKVGVVYFSHGAFLATGLTDNLSAIESAIDAIVINANPLGGTATGEGIRVAKEELLNNGVSDDKIILFFSDGAPTYHSTSICINVNHPVAPNVCTDYAVTQATAAKDAGVYIIGVGLLPAQDIPWVENLLISLVTNSSDYYPADLFTDLDGIFDNLTSNVCSVAEELVCGDDLVGYWKFDDASGTVANDSSGNGNNGTLMSMDNADWVSGQVSGALDFAGSDNYVTIPDIPDYSLSSMTVSLWAKDDDGIIKDNGLITKYGGGQPYEWGFYFDASSLYFTIISDVNTIYIGRKDNITRSTPTDTNWHHYAAVWDGGLTNGAIKLYIDGVRVDDFDHGGGVGFAGIADTASEISIGHRYSSTDGINDKQWDGLIDEVGLYDRALSETEILEQYNRGLAGNSFCVASTPCFLDNFDDSLLGDWNVLQNDSVGYSFSGGKLVLDVIADASTPRNRLEAKQRIYGDFEVEMNFSDFDRYGVGDGMNGQVYMKIEFSDGFWVKWQRGKDCVFSCSDYITVFYKDSTDLLPLPNFGQAWHVETTNTSGIFKIRRQGNTLIYYFNGVEKYRKTFASLGDYATPSISAATVGTQDFRVKIDDFKINYGCHDSCFVDNFTSSVLNGNWTVVQNNLTGYSLSGGNLIADVDSVAGVFTKNILESGQQFNGDFETEVNFSEFGRQGGNGAVYFNIEFQDGKLILVGRGKDCQLKDTITGNDPEANYIDAAFNQCNTDYLKIFHTDATQTSHGRVPPMAWVEANGDLSGILKVRRSGNKLTFFYNDIEKYNYTFTSLSDVAKTSLELRTIGNAQDVDTKWDDFEIAYGCYEPACGDGIIGFDEQCDDGGITAGDGCSATCQYEACSEPGLLGYWRFDETSGSMAHDYSTRGNDGTVSGATMGQTGIIGNAFNFNNTAINKVNVTSNDWTFTDGDFSISAWVNLNNISEPSTLVDFTNGGWQIFYFDEATGWTFDVGSGAPNTIIQECTTPGCFNTSANQWHFVTLVREGTSWKIYLDGVVTKSITTIRDILSTNELTIGYGDSYDLGGKYFNGEIDELSIWNKSLTISEVQDLYNGGVATYICQAEPTCGNSILDSGEQCDDGNANSDDGCSATCQYEVCSETGLVAYWTLNEKDGKFAKDISGNDNNGTHYGNTRLLMHFDDIEERTTLYNSAIAHWKLNESAGLAIDATGNGHDGTVTGTTMIGHAVFDGGYYFSGGNNADYVKVTSGDFDSITSFTLSAWVKPMDDGTFGRNVLGYSAGGVGEEKTYQLFAKKDGASIYIAHGNSTPYTHLSTVMPDDGKWHHVSATFSDANDIVKIYIDGELKNSTTDNRPLFFQNPVDRRAFLIGTSDGSLSAGMTPAQTFEGIIDEPAIWGTALTDAQILEIYRDGLIEDESAYNNNGRIQNDTTTSTDCPSGECVVFDGKDDFVVVRKFNQSYGNIEDNFSIELWAYPTATHDIDTESITGADGINTPQNYAVFPSHGDQYWGTRCIVAAACLASTYAGAGISIGTNGVSVYEHDHGHMPATLVHSTAINGWTHVVVNYVEGTPSLYINGAFVKYGLKSAKQHIMAMPENLGGTIPHGFYNGSIDEFAIYSEPLTATEIEEHYNNSRARFIDWTDGRVEGGLGFDGKNDYTELTSSIDYPVNYSYSVWLKTDVDIAETYQVVGAPGGIYLTTKNGVMNHGTSTGQNSTSQLSFGKNALAISGLWSGHVPLMLWYDFSTPKTDWTHVVISSDDGNGKVYVDGALIGNFTDKEGLSIDHLGYRAIGYNSVLHYYSFNGTMDDFSVWNRSLTLTEIQDIYNSGAGKYICEGISANASVCGDGVLNGTEQCDEGILNTNTACTAEYGSSCTYCNLFCIETNVTGPYCGDTIVTPTEGEQCDGVNYNAQTCITLGFDGGSLSCNTCGFDTSACTRNPGACTYPSKQYCYNLANNGACQTGIRKCKPDGSAWDTCQLPAPGDILEVCGDNFDNDCDGEVDETCAVVMVREGAVINDKTVWCNETVSDGICPEFFEDENGTRPDCSSTFSVKDIDCLKSHVSFKFQDVINDSNIVSATNNRPGATVSTRENTWEGKYAVSAVVDGDSAATSNTTIDFENNFVGRLEFVLFDNQAIDECLPAGPGYVEPCYVYANEVLTVRHALSKHLILAQFDMRGAGVLLFLLVLLGVLVPLMAIHYAKTKHLLPVSLHINMFKHSVNEPHDDYHKVKNYVEEALMHGHAEEHIKEKLKKHGWEENVVHMVFHDVHVAHNDLSKLKKYVESAVEIGLSKKQISGGLLKAGWKKEKINKMFEKLKK